MLVASSGEDLHSIRCLFTQDPRSPCAFFKTPKNTRKRPENLSAIRFKYDLTYSVPS